MEYQPSQKRVLITTMGKFGQPVVAKYKIGEALYDDTVAKKKRELTVKYFIFLF